MILRNFLRSSKSTERTEKEKITDNVNSTEYTDKKKTDSVDLSYKEIVEEETDAESSFGTKIIAVGLVGLTGIFAGMKVYSSFTGKEKDSKEPVPKPEQVLVVNAKDKYYKIDGRKIPDRIDLHDMSLDNSILKYGKPLEQGEEPLDVRLIPLKNSILKYCKTLEDAREHNEEPFYPLDTGLIPVNTGTDLTLENQDTKGLRENKFVWQPVIEKRSTKEINEIPELVETGEKETDPMRIKNPFRAGVRFNTITDILTNNNNTLVRERVPW